MRYMPASKVLITFGYSRIRWFANFLPERYRSLRQGDHSGGRLVLPAVESQTVEAVPPTWFSGEPRDDFEKYQ